MTGHLLTQLGTAASILATAGLAIAALITGRKTNQKTSSETKAIDQKLPPEVDSIVVQGAEAAVLTMGKALQAANHRIDELETLREQDRKRIEEMEGEIKTLRVKVDSAERGAREAREQLDKIQDRMTQLMHDNQE